MGRRQAQLDNKIRQRLLIKCEYSATPVAEQTIVLYLQTF